MVRILCSVLFALTLQQGTGFAQPSKRIPFKNDPQISSPDGKVTDSVGNTFLYKLQEPLLSNYYTGRDVYRLTIQPSLLLSSMLISIEKAGDSIWVTTKEIQETADPDERRQTYYQSPYQTYALTQNNKKPLGKEQFETLVRLIDTLMRHPEGSRHPGNDGTDWIIEISTASGYYRELRWSPSKGDPLKNVADMMVDVSDLHHKKFVRKM